MKRSFGRKVGILTCLIVAFFIVVPGVVAIWRSVSDSYDEAVAQKQIDDLVMPVVRIKGGVDLPDGRVARWTGSGVVLYSKADPSAFGFVTYVLTCNHVVEKPVFDENSPPSFGFFGPPPKITGWKYGVDYVELFSPNGTSRKVSGYVVAQSNNNLFELNDDGDLVVKTKGEPADFDLGAGEDLALVRLETSERIPSVKMMLKEDISKLRRFFGARVVGCSLGGRPYNTVGEITVLQDDYMSVNAQFVPGNSGGAVYLDKTHEFLGITNAGPRGVWHMGMVRPLKRIYSWLDQTGHTFLYEPSVSVDIRDSIVVRDRDLHIADVKKEKEDQDKLIRQLSRAVKKLSEAVPALEKQSEDLQKQVDFLTEKVAVLDCIRERFALLARAVFNYKEPVVPKNTGISGKSGVRYPPPRPGGPVSPPVRK